MRLMNQKQKLFQHLSLFMELLGEEADPIIGANKALSAVSDLLYIRRVDLRMDLISNYSNWINIFIKDDVEVKNSSEEEANINKVCAEDNILIQLDSNINHDPSVKIKMDVIDIIKKTLLHYLDTDQNGLKKPEQDNITGLPNMSRFICDGATLSSQESLHGYVAIYLSIKGLKMINLRYCYTVGDTVLIKYANMLKGYMKNKGMIARIGGGNFILLLKKEYEEECISLFENVTIDVEHEGVKESITFHSRFAIYRIQPEDTITTAVKRCTGSYNVLKTMKESNIIYFDYEVNERLFRLREMERVMYQSLEDKEFHVYYQPKVNLITGKIVGAEALVRWVKNNELLLPQEFIPLFEENGFIRKIDFEVLEIVCRDIRDWMKRGINFVKVSINFSKKHFIEPDVGQKIMRIIDHYEIPHEYIEIEFTETAYLEQSQNLALVMEELKKAGLATAMDDFGTGYASHHALQELEFDVLKLDRSYLKAITERGKIVLNNIVQMANQLDMCVVSEGIENKEHVAFLKDIHCYMGQGYIFDKPLPISEYEKRLNKGYYEI